MTIDEQIKALKRGNTGDEILTILNAVTGSFKELSNDKELVIAAALPDPGYFIMADGRQVVFWWNKIYHYACYH